MPSSLPILDPRNRSVQSNPSLGFTGSRFTNRGYSDTSEVSPFTPDKAYPAAIETQAGDYDELMKRYRNILDSPNNTGNLMSAYKTNMQPLTYEGYTPKTSSYSTTPGISTAMSNLEALSKSGGYSEADLGNIRARGIAPIRSIYDSARRNLERQKSLQGGFSPNMGALQLRMARELSGQIGEASTRLEGDIADRQAQGRLSVASPLASLASSEAGRRSSVNQANQNAINQANAENTRRKLEVDSRNQEMNYRNQQTQIEGQTTLERLIESQKQARLQALEGMRGVYGTTPALANLYGNQVANFPPPKKVRPGGISLENRGF